jgi:DNA mismatch repair ATPase MutS
MDEPMHSTHPIDGSIMLKSLMLHLASYPKLTVVLTSHYFLLQDLAKERPGAFMNLSVRAKMPEVDFDFKIYKGGSRQTVGIELLEKEGFEAICATAIKIKQILYPDEVNV